MNQEVGDLDRLFAMQNKLFKLEQPTFYITITDERSFDELYLTLTASYKDAVIRMIRGKKTKSCYSFASEVAAVLQFPYYYGENGAAFDECIVNLEWLPASAYLLTVRNGWLFLSDTDDREFQSWVKALSEANEEWLNPDQHYPRDRQPTPFHILFQCSEEEIESFCDRFRKATMEFEIL